MSPARRLLIVDDHPLFRAGLRKLLESEPGFDVCGEAGDAATAVAATQRLAPDLLLLDMAMPGGSGLEVLRLLTDVPIPTHTIVLTAEIGRLETVQAVQLGARGIVLKAAASDVLFDCMGAVLEGDYWLGAVRLPSQESSLIEALHRREAPGDFNLTRREREIIAALVSGLSNREIAQQFGVTEITVKHHLRSIFDKCGSSNRLELALFALRHGLARL
jgi:DNA-binding NarL/FixJ family response regulator